MSNNITKFGFRKLGVDNYSAWSKHFKGLLGSKGLLDTLTAANHNHIETLSPSVSGGQAVSYWILRDREA